MKYQAYFYKSLPHLHIVIHLLEFSCTLTLMIKISMDQNFFFPNNDVHSSNTTSQSPETTEIVFISLFLVTEFLPFITFISLLVLVPVLPLFLYACVAVICTEKTCEPCTCLCTKKWFYRFMSLNCNCPCYRARPQFRFGFRFGFLLICFLLRITVLVGCLMSTRSNTKKLGIICGISCVFLILQLLLDFYHYRVLWHYVPQEDNLPKKTLSSKHKRYIPYHLLGHSRTNDIGNYPCKNKNHCRNRQLEHILIFHATDYQPQPRWSEVKTYTNNDIYIGFHQTLPEYAIAIAHSDFKPSMNPPQMLGFGIYFARSLHNTFGKARNQGAFICAEIKMGKVKEVTFDELCHVRNSKTWWDEYDTVYYNHADDKRDEFCIKDSSQIIRWVIAINNEYDKKIHDYGMEREFDDTACGCF